MHSIMGKRIKNVFKQTNDIKVFHCNFFFKSVFLLESRPTEIKFQGNVPRKRNQFLKLRIG
jgi:hypothetical protein